jgi:ABC-type sugar transport system ATPase subunit
LELYHHPQNQFVAGFIGSPKMNFVKGKVLSVDARGVTVEYGEARPATIPLGNGAKTGDDVTLGIRPEHIGEGAGLGVSLTGTVEAVELLGEASFVYLRRDDGTALIARAPGDSQAQVGAKIAISTSADHLHLFDAAGQAFARHSKADAA